MNLKRSAVCYGAYLCVFTVLAVLGKTQGWEVEFPFLIFGGGALFFGLSRFTSYYDRHPAAAKTPEGETTQAFCVRAFLRWAPFLWGVLTALPPLLYVFLS